MHLEVPNWTFFNSLFCVDFKAIQFVMIWPNLDQDIAKILKGSHFKNYNFLVITESKTLRNTPKHSGAPMSTPDHSGAVMSCLEHSLGLISNFENCDKVLWVLMEPWCHAHECSLVFMSAVGNIAPCSWVLMAAFWMLTSAQQCSWALSSHEHSWEPWPNEPSWTIISTHWYSWALMCLAPWHQQHS